MTKFISSCLFCAIFLVCVSNVVAQSEDSTRKESQELSDVEGIPVILKHLPDWENKQKDARFINSKERLLTLLGERPVFETVDFIADTEAVTANYPEGKLLIVEYGTPQASVDTDNKVKAHLSNSAQTPPVFYRRIGNYSVFLFDGTSEASANSLFDKIKYQKVVRWLNYDPFAQRRAEKGFIRDTKDLFLATAIAVGSGLLVALVLGAFVGVIFYRIRQRQRATMNAFSDGGGLTRINLDELT